MEININELRLSYNSLGAGENCVLFIHGNSANKENFQYQKSTDFLPNVRKIFVDLPGHGHSAHCETVPCTEAYTLPFYAETLAAFIKELQLEKPLVVGHSMGGHIANHLSRRVELAGLFSFQAPPLESSTDAAKAFQPVEELGLLFTADYTEAGLESLMQKFFVQKQIIPAAKLAFQNTDPKARELIGASLMVEWAMGELSHWNSLKIPKAILHADSDPMINKDYLMQLPLHELWQEQLLPVAGVSHYPHIENPKVFNKYLQGFIEAVFA